MIEQTDLANIRRDLVIALLRTASVSELKNVDSILGRAKALEAYIRDGLVVKKAPGRPPREDADKPPKRPRK